jgi:hypothetical protein
MRLDFDDIHYRIRTDHRFKKRLKKLVLFGGLGLLLVAVLGVIGIILFSSAIMGFLFSNASGFYELAFNYLRDFTSSFMLEDLTALLNPITDSTNATEMKNLITRYYDQLKTNPSIDFQNFQNFIATVKKSLLDNQISNTELDLVRQFVLN